MNIRARITPCGTACAAMALLIGAVRSGAAQDAPPRVILYVADGAGVGHWTAALLAADDAALRQFPVVGLIETRGSDHLITGSAAAATSYATGMRTFSGAIGVGPDSVTRQTVLEAAQDRGMATGLVTTARLTDATPAAFATHVLDRRHEWEIARQLAGKSITVLLGGGRSRFEAQWRPDGVDLVAHLKERYTYVETAGELRALHVDTVDALLGLFASVDMPAAATRSPKLDEMAQAALTVLDKDPDGFFLLVESEGPDNLGHERQPIEKVVNEMFEFDFAIRRGLVYQRGHPETLIVVLSDHETGGLSLQADSLGRLATRYTAESHTLALVPIFASGPGAQRFGGIIENQRVGQLLLEAVQR